MNQATEQRIECESGRLLCRFDRRGLWLWCDKHKRSELITWGELETVRRQCTQEVMVTITSATSATPA